MTTIVLLSFYALDQAGLWRCKVCETVSPDHDPRCPIVALRQEVQEVVAQHSFYVLELREVLTNIETLLKDGTA